MGILIRPVLLTLCMTAAAVQALDCNYCHRDFAQKQIDMNEVQTLTDLGVAMMDKGELGNYTSNAGDMSNYHLWMNDAMHWPRSANDATHYSYGLGLMVGIRDNVADANISRLTGSTDWQPVDGSRGTLFSGDLTASDDTPYLAMSDLEDTWPLQDEEHTWPGEWRRSTQPDSWGERMEGEYTSDRDIYYQFSDDGNRNGALGIRVTQNAYSYGRPYARDLVFFESHIENTTDQPLDSVWVGYYVVFRPDYDFQDYLNHVVPEPDGDMIYVYDRNNQNDGAWEDNTDPIGIIGLAMLETPDSMGMTDFHYFRHEHRPDNDERLWRLISSEHDSAHFDNPEFFFHGDDPRVDDTSPALMNELYPEGARLNFVVTTGPLSFAPGEIKHSSIAVIMGESSADPFQPDTSDLMENYRFARQMYKSFYQGSGPPAVPTVYGAPGNHEATVWWTAEPSESSIDVMTGENDFEGYRVYRSTDRGISWGDPITNYRGEIIGWEPLAIFDRVNGITGEDPLSHQWLGFDSGLQHTYIDSNLVNGVEYWYAVTAYDRGQLDEEPPEASYETPRGTFPVEPQIVSITPGLRAVNAGEIPEAGELLAEGLPCEDQVFLDIIAPDELINEEWRITFEDSVEVVLSDTTIRETRFHLINSDDDTVLYQQPFSDASGDNLPVVHGFRLRMLHSPTASVEYGWTVVQYDTCTFDWWTEQRDPNNVSEVPETIIGYEDFAVEILADSISEAELVETLFSEEPIIADTILVPLRIWKITDPENPVDVTEYLRVEDLRLYFQGSSILGPLGWDLIPGGAGSVPMQMGPAWYSWLMDCLILRDGTDDATNNQIWVKTNNFDYIIEDGDTTAVGVPPSPGDRFEVHTGKPFRAGVTYRFSTRAVGTTSASVDLSRIRAVPDPYIVTNAWEQIENGKRLMFTHLPDRCEIDIYTVTGDHIRHLEHSDQTGYEFWDLRTRNDQFIAYGLYVFVVTTDAGDTHTGRFMVIR